jgi:SHS2 domain-containing protein
MVLWLNDDAELPPDSAGRWEHFAAGALIGVRGLGPSPAAAFAQAGLAVTAVVTDPARVRADSEVVVVCTARRLDELFFDWIDSVIATMDAQRMLFSRFDVRVVDGRIEAQLFGEALHHRRHAPVLELEAPSWSGLRVAHDPSGWSAECAVDTRALHPRGR